MNIQNILGQLLGSQGAQTAMGTGGQMLDQAKASIPGGLAGGLGQNIPDGVKGFGGGMAAGSILGLLVGNKKVRKKIGKMGGGVVGYGGAAALGALAHSAFQKYQANAGAQQAGQPGVQVPQPQPALAAPTPNGFWATQTAGADPVRFELMVVKAMIAAANADGHIDTDERNKIYDSISQVPLAGDEKALLFDTLAKPPSVETIAAAAGDMEQASALYVASRIAIDPDEPTEQAHLDKLAAAMNMPNELVASLEHEIARAELPDQAA